MTTTELSGDGGLPIRPPSRDSLEFSAGLALGVAAGIGLGLALATPALRKRIQASGRRCLGMRRRRSAWSRMVRGWCRG